MINQEARVPPQDLSAEASVLGVLLIEKDRIDEVIEILPEANMFYAPEHETIYKAILEMSAKGQQIDLITLSAHLRNDGLLETIGGISFLTKLTLPITSGAHVSSWANLVRDKWERRVCINAYGQAHHDLFNESQDVTEIVSNLEFQITRALDTGSTNRLITMSEGVKELLKDIELAKYRPEGLTGLNTGLIELNRLTNGWQKTDLIILAARPGVGKTAFLLSTALANGRPGLIFSLEMGRKQLLERMVSAITGIYYTYIKSKKLSESELKKLVDMANQISMLKIYIDDRPGLSIQQIKATSRRYARKFNIEWIGIDYLQLAKGSKGNSKNREQEISEISRELKGLAKELEVPIIALSQLNRSVEGRSNPRPNTSDLRESGAIEQDADLILFLFNQQNSFDPNVWENWVSLAKHRGGECDDFQVKFLKHIQKFVDKDHLEPDMPPQNYYNANAGMPKRLPYTDDKDEEVAPW